MKKISIIGLGYVGLPLACILGYKKNKNLQVVGVATDGDIRRKLVEKNE